jgi:peptidase E
LVTSPNIEIASTIEGEVYEKELGTFEAMALVDFITFPHWGSDYFKDLYLKNMQLAYKPKNKIILLNDYQYVAVTEQKYEIIDIRQD